MQPIYAEVYCLEIFLVWVSWEHVLLFKGTLFRTNLYTSFNAMRRQDKTRSNSSARWGLAKVQTMFARLMQSSELEIRQDELSWYTNKIKILEENIKLVCYICSTLVIWSWGGIYGGQDDLSLHLLERTNIRGREQIKFMSKRGIKSPSVLVFTR